MCPLGAGFSAQEARNQTGNEVNNMTLCKMLATMSAAVVLSLNPPALRADEIAEKGRAIFDKYKHVVVTVHVVMKSKVSVSGRGAQSRENRLDLTGTVVDPSGLTVMSLSATDPGQLVQNLSGTGDDESRFKMETELTEVKMMLEDGKETDADVVFKDKELDLVFIRPKVKPAAPMVTFDLSNSANANLLDVVIALNRLGNAAGRSYAAAVERISAIVESPRLVYIPETSITATALGAPAFTLDGKALGLFVMRAMKGRGGMFGVSTDSVTGIIVPAADVLKAMKQVPPPQDATK
jgi:S1-C subfamily serine protease